MSTTEYERFMLEIHARFPGVTAQMYGRAPGQELSPYDLLADLVPDGAEGVRVLDLGCGDGYLLELLSTKGLRNPALFGVDISEAELDAARQRGLDADFRDERAESLSLPDADVDYVFCHMAFPMMAEPERVTSEVARVLKPGGCFAIVIHGTRQTDPLFVRFGEMLSRAMEDEGLERWSVCYGADNPKRDVRDTSNDGLRRLFNERTGFVEPIDIEELTLPATCSLEQTWARFSNHYDFFRLSDARRDALKEEFMAEATRAAGADATVEVSPRLRRVTCRRLDPDSPR